MKHHVLTVKLSGVFFSISFSGIFICTRHTSLAFIFPLWAKLAILIETGFQNRYLEVRFLSLFFVPTVRTKVLGKTVFPAIERVCAKFFFLFLLPLLLSGCGKKLLQSDTDSATIFSKQALRGAAYAGARGVTGLGA